MLPQESVNEPPLVELRARRVCTRQQINVLGAAQNRVRVIPTYRS